jgi:dTMP kinase
VIAIDLSGRLIAFEGIDTSGKTTQAHRLAHRLAQAGVPVVSTGEPGGTKIGETVREILLAREYASMLPLSELLLFMVSRVQNTHEVIVPALALGKTVVASRYRMSSLAYQGYGRGLDLELIGSLNERATGGLHPDLTFLIDLPADVAVRRKSTGQDRIEVETLAFHHRVRDGFLRLADDRADVIVIDGTRPADEVEQEVFRTMQRRFCRSGQGSGTMGEMGITR